MDVSWEDFGWERLAEGVGRRRLPGWDATTGLIVGENAVLLYGPTFAEQHNDAAKRFMAAYLRGVRDYYRAFFGDGQGKDEIIELLTRITSVRDRALLERTAPTWMDPNGSVTTDSLRAVQQWYAERGELTGELDLDRVIDLSFVDYALGRIGRYTGP